MAGRSPEVTAGGGHGGHPDALAAFVLSKHTRPPLGHQSLNKLSVKSGYGGDSLDLEAA